MKSGFLALAFLLIVSPFVKAQDTDVPQTHPFSISSLNTPFAMQGEFEGEYRIYPGRIELRVTKANIRISEHCPYKGRRLLSALKFGLATTTDDKRWKIANAGEEFVLQLVMSPGDKYSLSEFYFYLPKDQSLDLSKHWLVVQLDDTVLDFPEEKRRKGHAYAHSSRDIFAQAK